VHSVAGMVDPKTGAVGRRPFRAPHHSVSEPGLVGGGEIPRPGEISLAHRGVLFLDELAEFRRSTLEALRQPLEDGFVTISRARARVWFPAQPLLVAATNPCPCGYHGHPTQSCRCGELQRHRYLMRLSGPLLDRIDLHCGVPPVEVASLSGRSVAESSEEVRRRVEQARQKQAERAFQGVVAGTTNSTLTLREAHSVTALGSDAQKLLECASHRLGLSARAYLRILRVARTIADLEDSSTVQSSHVAEAIQGRLLDRDTSPS
jgi:magnesium chelatase family protein